MPCRFEQAPRRHCLIPRFEDRDFMAELNRAPAERRTACIQLLREEALEVWREYGQLVSAGEVKHY